MLELNLVILAGTYEEPKRSDAGGPLVFSLHTMRSFQNREGADVTRQDWIDCKAWGKTAEILTERVTEGEEILVHGFVEKESWTTKDGSKRSRQIVTVTRVTFLHGRTENQAAKQQEEPSARSRKPVDRDDPPDDDLPF